VANRQMIFLFALEVLSNITTAWKSTPRV